MSQRDQLHKAEAEALAARMIQFVRHQREKRQAEEPAELSTEKSGTIQT